MLGRNTDRKNLSSSKWWNGLLSDSNTNRINRSHGKESTEVQITQNKGKESENSYQKLKRSL